MFQLNNNRYELDGLDILAITEEFGTPLYVYSAETIRSQYERFTSAFSGITCKVKFACKALSNISILRYAKSLGMGLDTVSIEEVRLGLLAGFDKQEIIYTPNCVSFDEIKQAIELGVVVNIDSLSILEQFGHEFGSRVPISIRLNPHILAGGNHHLQTGHIDSKFGISIYQIRHLLRIVKSSNIKIIGLHCHTGSDILDAGVFLQGAELLFDAAKNFEDLQYIDFGSGFKVPYKMDDVVTDIESFGSQFSESFKEFCKEYGRELEAWFEPGKYIVSEAGLFLVSTNVIKQTVSTVFAGVNSGQNHLLRPMMYDAYHNVINISNPTGNPRVYSVVGYICETDTFAWDRKINEVNENDVLCFFNAGAYGFQMSSNYNSRLKPAEVLVHNGKAQLVRKREQFDDLLRNQIEIEL